MSCDAVAAVFMLFAANGPMPSQPVLTRVADAPSAIKVDIAQEPLFVDIVSLADRKVPLLFDVRADPSESYNLASAHPQVLADLSARFQRARARFEPMGVRR